MQEHNTLLGHESLVFLLRITYFQTERYLYISRKGPYWNFTYKIPKDRRVLLVFL